MPARTSLPKNWIRSVPFSPRNESRELWSCENHLGRRVFEVRVTCGKKLDAFSLKQKVLSDFERSVTQIRQKNESLFASNRLEEVQRCPVCGESSEGSEAAASFYGGSYHHCLNCDHYFVIKRPSKESLENFYATSQEYQATYADPDLVKVRLETVAAPKAEWVLKTFRDQYGKNPRSLLDVGAGSGHMVKAFRDQGIEADGIEISESGIEFAKRNFGIALERLDFIGRDTPDRFAAYDVITFWGCLEHVPDPIRMLEAARGRLNQKTGMVVAEVPRWHSLTTEIQKLFTHRIVRHLEPSSHLHVFSDASLASTYGISGFIPAAAWYFGLDTYEAAVQSVREHGGRLDKVEKYISYFQPLCDQHHLCDFLVLAGIPDTVP